MTASEFPNGETLKAICRRAVDGFNVEPESLAAFLTESQDPDWCRPEAARQLAKRMHDGLILWRPGQ